MGWETLPEVPGWVGRPSRRLGMGRGTLPEVRYRLRDHQGGPGREGGTAGVSGMDWGTLREVRDWLGNLPEVGDRLEDHSKVPR